MSDRPFVQLAGNDITGKFDAVLDPTVPASAMSGPFVQNVPRGDGVPLALHLRFQGIRRIGAGGMGVVYCAMDPKLGREVALKLLKHGDPASWSKFLAEARAQARVEHDHICRVYEVGEADGEPYIVMQLIDGEPLSLARHHMSVRQRVTLVQNVAQAISAAHAAGLVHRDIKPGNILVERKDDGSFRPYVVDFGIASVVEGGVVQTQQGALGTPAYMAPEVALHRDRKVIDARVDVYGLGATLYELLSGRTPFVGSDALDILAKLEREDPPPLRAIAKSIPVELEAIVMKSIDREPDRRYATMAAFADDLQRFLEGETILARRVGFRYAVRRLARKHVRALFVGAMGLTLVTTIGILRRNATEQAELAEDLGRTVTEMELYMRTAYQSPPHDIERERAVVRDRVQTLEKRVGDAGADQGGAAQYALGRAYLALGDDVRAADHLARAEVLGYSSPELGYALSIAQLQAYVKLKGNLEWYEGDVTKRKMEIDGLTSRYFTPALERFQQVVPARIEHPAYAAALAAFYAKDHAKAAEKAREAFEHAPLLYEAKLLEATALANVASAHWSSGKIDWWDKMNAGMQEAFKAYSIAENIGRSDPRVLKAYCLSRTTTMYAAFTSRKVKAGPYFTAAREVCDRLVLVDPSGAESRVTRASMYALHAYVVAGDERNDGDALDTLEEAVKIAEDAVQVSAASLPASENLGNVLRARAMVMLDRGLDASEALKTAERHYIQVRDKYKYDWNLRDSLAYVYELRAEHERRRGIESTEAAEKSNQLIDELLAANHLPMMAWTKRGAMHNVRARQQLEHGRSPRSSVEGALAALGKAYEINPAFSVGDGRISARAVEVQYAHDLGESGRKSLDLMPRDVEDFRQWDPGSATEAQLAGIVAMLEAEERMLQGHDPQAFFEAARKAFRQATERYPWRVEFATQWARVEWDAARVARTNKTANAATFAAIRAPLATWITDKLVFPDAHALVAQSHALAAEWLRARKESPEDEIKAGLEMADRALAVNPKHAVAQATRGQLWLVRAQGAGDASVRAEAAKNAVLAFEQALQANPLLERQYGSALNEARRMD